MPIIKLYYSIQDTYIKRIKFEKLSDLDIAFPETLHHLHEKKTPTMQSTSVNFQGSTV
jgi:hypothetical protein